MRKTYRNQINQWIDKIDFLISKIKSYYYNKPQETDSDESKKLQIKYQNNNSNENNEDLKIDIDYKKYSLFYQEEKGDIYYLDPLIMKILLSEYGDYNSLPTEIEGNILDISMIQVTPEFKSKYKYLNHLRIGSIIYFIEIDINDLISSTTKNKFNEKLKERKRIRNLLKKQEKNYELFLIKKNSKLSEEEKESDSTIYDSKKSLEHNLEPLFFISDEESEKKENNENKEKIDIINNEIKKENKLSLLFEEKEKEDKEKKVEEKNDFNSLNKKNEKGGKKKKINKKSGKKGKKVKEKVFNSEKEEDFSEYSN